MGYLVVGTIGAVLMACGIAIVSATFQLLTKKTLRASRFGVLSFFSLFICAFTVVGVIQGRQSSWGLDLIVAGFLAASVPLSFLWPQKSRQPGASEGPLQP